MRKRDLERCRAILLAQRERILANADRVLSCELELDPDDFPDEMDAALAESSLSFTGRMRERERGLLNKIEKTLPNAFWPGRWRVSVSTARTSRSGSSASAIEPQLQLAAFGVASDPAGNQIAEILR